MEIAMPAIRGMVKDLVEHCWYYLSCDIIYNEDETKAWLCQPHMVKKIALESLVVL